MNLPFLNSINKADKYFNENDTIDNYTIQSIIGEGRYGIVYLAVDEKNDKYVIKQLRKEMIKKAGNKLLYEEMILRKLQAPNFPKFISKFKEEDREGYILEYIEGKVYEDILRKDKYQFNRMEIYEVCDQLINLIDILHSCNISHRDIRLPNVILKDNNELALIDFGLARNIDHNYTKELDYWYIGDFLIHLYYSSYQKVSKFERPWFKELDLKPEEKVFLKRLMGIEESFENIHEIRQHLNIIKNNNK